MVLEAGILEAYERFPIPELPFADRSNTIINYTFAGALCVALSIVVVFILDEIIRYINE